MSAAVAMLNRPSQNKESSHEMGTELLSIKIQLTHPLADSMAVSAGALLFIVLYTMLEKRQDLIFVLVKERHD